MSASLSELAAGRSASRSSSSSSVRRCARHVVLHLEPDHLAEPPLEHLLLDRRQQILRLLEVGELEVGVARDAERVPADDLHPGEERLEILPDHLLQRHELVRATGHLHPAAEALRHLHASEVHRAEHGIAHLDRERERQVGDVGKRVPHVDRERREHGKDLRLELLVDRATLGRREVSHPDDAHAVRRELLEQSAQAAPSVFQQVADALLDDDELLGDRQPVRRGVDDPRRELPPQSADAHHEVLVEVAVEDREELEALEQRHAPVRRLVHDARVEREPAQLAVQVQGFGGRVLGHRSSRGLLDAT